MHPFVSGFTTVIWFDGPGGWPPPSADNRPRYPATDGKALSKAFFVERDDRGKPSRPHGREIRSRYITNTRLGYFDEIASRQKWLFRDLSPDDFDPPVFESLKGRRTRPGGIVEILFLFSSTWARYKVSCNFLRKFFYIIFCR